MPEFIRVKAVDTGHEYSIVASAFNKDAHELLDNKAATECDGSPLPPKHNVSLGGLSKPSPESGTTSEKEGA